MSPQQSTAMVESARGDFLVYEAEDGRVKLEACLQDETVWLTQDMMAMLFQTSRQNVSPHILNVYEEGELEPRATHKKFVSVGHEGARKVSANLL